MFRNKIDSELLEARVSKLKNPEAHLMRSLPLNRLKPFRKRRVYHIIINCVFRPNIIENAFRIKRLDRNTHI